MSVIRFHTSDGTVLTVNGGERSRASAITVEATLRALGAVDDAQTVRLVRTGVIPAEALTFGQTPGEALRGWLQDFLGMNTVEIDGEESPIMAAVLNTAAVTGSDAVAFLARLHGSVEHRIWVATEDVPWLASVIREVTTLSDDSGWERVAVHLDSTSGPLVVSTSQGRDFPEGEFDDETEEYILPESFSAAWSASLAVIQAEGWWLQVTPENLHQPAYTPLRTFPTPATAGENA